MKAKLIYFVCLLILLHQTIDAKTLHAIIVADTVHDIRSITKPDLSLWQKELRQITKHTKMSLKEKVFSGHDFDKEKIKHYLKGLRIEQSDAVIFYFSGHGYRTYQKETPWPFLTFEFYKPGLDVQWVADVLRSKKGGLTLVISDCCNNFIERGQFSDETKRIQINLKQFPPNYAGYKELFCKAKGCIVISSCSEGQMSWGSPIGGLYTQCFFTSLNHELNEKKPSWKKLLQRANGLIKHVQTPICKVYR